MISVVATCALLLVVLTGCAVLSMLVETWSVPRRRSRRAARPAPARPPVGEPGGQPAAASLPDTSLPVESPVIESPADERLVVVPGRAAADRVVAVLIAAYVASGGTAARRAAAWVTADARSSLGGAPFEPGSDLRGRTVAVRRLLELDEDGRCWLTLRDGVDIQRGLVRHPVTSPTLDGALGLWRATRAVMSAVSADEVAHIVATIDELEPHWAATTGAASLGPVALQLRAAARHHRGARIQVRLTPPPTAEGTGSPASTPDARESV